MLIQANIASNKNQQYKSAIIVLISMMKRFTHFYFHVWSVILHWLQFDGCIKKPTNQVLLHFLYTGGDIIFQNM